MQEKLEKAIDVNAPSIVIWLEKEFPIKGNRMRKGKLLVEDVNKNPLGHGHT